MTRKLWVFLLTIGILLLVILVLQHPRTKFSEEQGDALKATRVVKAIARTSTWRRGSEPFDIGSSVKNQLERVGFKVVGGADNQHYDALLRTDYSEEQGRPFSAGGFTTNIKLSVTLTHKRVRGKLFDKTVCIEPFPTQVIGTTMATEYDLYQEALRVLSCDPLIKYLGEFVASALNISGGDYASVLVSALKDNDGETQNRAADALLRLSSDEPSMTDEITRLLVPVLKDTLADARHQAVRVLGDLKARGAVEALIEVLRNDNEGIIRSTAAYALGEIGDRRAVGPLADALSQDSQAEFRAAVALAEMGDTRAVDTLIRYLKDELCLTRQEAARTLGHLGNPKALNSLKRISEDDPYAFVREAATKAVNEIEANAP